MPFDLKTYARVGATARLAELQQEMDEIYRAFPDLRSPGRRRRDKAAVTAGSADAEATSRRRRRKPMTSAQRKAVGLRMKKYWAARRKREAKE